MVPRFKDINELTSIVINLLFKIHDKYGGACLEKVYEEIFYYELIKLGIKVERQLLLDILYDDTLLIKNAYKVDLIIDDQLVLELKIVYPLPSAYFKQIHTQLSLLNLKNGMLANFKVGSMRYGIHRNFNNKGRAHL